MWGATSAGCHLQLPPLGCHFCSGATSVQKLPLLSYQLCSGATSAWALPPLRCHLLLGAISAQMPPPAGYHVCSGATSTQMPSSGWKRAEPVLTAPRRLLRCRRTPHSAGAPSHTISLPHHLLRHEHITAGMGTRSVHLGSKQQRSSHLGPRHLWAGLTSPKHPKHSNVPRMGFSPAILFLSGLETPFGGCAQEAAPAGAQL